MQLFYERVKYGERFGRLGLEDVYVNLINQVNHLGCIIIDDNNKIYSSKNIHLHDN